MLGDLLQSLISNDVQFMKDIWTLRTSEVDFSKLLESVSKLQTQLTVQKTLLCTEKLLREHPNDKPLPNQQATRIKHFIKFVFEANFREPTKQKQLRNLDCSSLKLCGLSYTVREIIDLPSEVFEYLVENVASFVERSQLSLPLCRDDINKVVLGDFDPEEEEVFKTFLTTHIALRLALRRSQQHTTPSNYSADIEPSSVISQKEQGDDQVRPQKRMRSKEQDTQAGMGREIQYMYSNAPVYLIPHLGDLLAEAIRSSHQWKVERALGESKTACLTTIIPKDPTQDVSINLWVGAEAGHQLNDKFNLVPKWTSLPNHVGL
ncbi:hypothetical protein BDV18DRAFT_148524 [Aspergillus unguis]